MMYYSKIEIIYKPLIKHYTKSIMDLGDATPEISIKELQKHGVTDNDTFSIFREYGTYNLAIYTLREETKEEMNTRILREEKYNKEYEEYHKKVKK